jgi:CMP-N,N'-diacetyllegionaminic acid synthase
MRILALITARGGSKRLPGKNIRPLNGRPLILWSIDVARLVPNICEILISTDDPNIAEICKDAGGYVPWLRPPELALDTTNSVDTALHALNWYESERGLIDGLLLLQPTSPFRTRETIIRGIELFTKCNNSPVVGVSPAKEHPLWTYKIDGQYLQSIISTDKAINRAQDLPPAYHVTGSFFLISPHALRQNQTFIPSNTLPLIIESPKEALDIDTEWDFKIAELILRDADAF